MGRKNYKIKFMKLYYKCFHKFLSPYYYNRILKEEGIEVGDHTIFYDPFSQTIDRERPWMLTIGDYCKITKGTIILTHDYSRSVLRRAFGEVIGEAKNTVIGDNVFIGMNSIILMGTHIGNNVIIGAGSVVSGNIPDNAVIAGNPARVIRTLDEHFSIRKNKTIDEAVEYFVLFKRKYHRETSIAEMNAFFPLYLERNRECLANSNVNIDLTGDNREEVIEGFLKTSPVFGSYDEFKKYATLNEDKI